MPFSRAPHEIPSPLASDGSKLFIARFTRMFAYGALSVILALYLSEIGLSEGRIGLLFALTLAGDTVVSLAFTTQADRWGRRRTLVAGSTLMLLAGIAFVLSISFPILLIAATIGVISPSGNEVGPFLGVEQAALSQILPGDRRTRVFSWYSLTGSIATAAGSLCGGIVSECLAHRLGAPAAGYRAVLAGYAVSGLLLAYQFTRLSSSIEVRPQGKTGTSPESSPFGVHRSRGVVWRLSGLFAVDSFAGGFVIQSLAAYWFHLRFGDDPAALGGIFFGANVLAGFSALVAARIASRLGLVRTMVLTHLPSNVLLILVPLMPNRSLAIATFLLRFSISQMDVPTRQSYLMAVVSPDERSAAAGITGTARTAGASISPLFAGMLLGNQLLMNVPFYLAGSLKILYDLVLYRGFVSLEPPEEAERHGQS